MQSTTIEYLQKLLEASNSSKQKKLIVVYGGRFQPFHKGHYECYLWLTNKFGNDNVWIATSNKTNFDAKNGDISPFNFKEKQQIITTLYDDIDPKRIIQCENPAFKPTEIFALYEKFDQVYLAAVGKKDKTRYLNSDFFHELPSGVKLPDEVSTLLSINEKGGYYIQVPMQVKGISGTQVREKLLSLEDEDSDRKEIFKTYFGSYNEMIDALIIAKLKSIK